MVTSQYPACPWLCAVLRPGTNDVPLLPFEIDVVTYLSVGLDAQKNYAVLNRTAFVLIVASPDFALSCVGHITRGSVRRGGESIFFGRRGQIEYVELSTRDRTCGKVTV